MLKESSCMKYNVDMLKCCTKIPIDSDWLPFCLILYFIIWILNWFNLTFFKIYTGARNSSVINKDFNETQNKNCQIS